MRILIGIQSRLKSKRLPNKAIHKIGNHALIEHVWKATNVVVYPNAVILYRRVLVPREEEDYQKILEDMGIQWCPGDGEDLIKRYMYAIEKFHCDAAIRITGDCWQMPQEIVQRCIKSLLSCDYVSNTMIRSMPEGYDIQGGSLKAWKWLDSGQRSEREHPWKEFDENKICRDDFERKGMKITHIVDNKNPIFQKTSIDTQEELDFANKRYEHKAS